MFEFENLPKEKTIAGKCNDNKGMWTDSGFIKVKPSNCVLPGYYQEELENIRNFGVRHDDVFVVSSPKSGTSWTMEMVWLIANDLDYETAKANLLHIRFPFIDSQGCASPEIRAIVLNKYEVAVRPGDSSLLNTLNALRSPRFMKSHLPKTLLPTQIWSKKPKIVFVARNSKDAAISNFHHYSSSHGYSGTLKEFLEATLKDEVMFSPFWEHIIEFWEMRNDPNVLFLTYEEMKKDLGAVIDKTVKFFGKEITPEQKTDLMFHLSFDEMKKNRSVNKEPIKEQRIASGVDVKGDFIREGKSGGWRESLSPEMARNFDDWTKSKIAGTGLEDIYGSEI